jgi:RNA polymerase sigma-70 factor (ECF subfamily)
VWEVSDAMTTADDPEQHLLEAADAHTLAALLDRLPPRQREVLLLRVAWGLSACWAAARSAGSPTAAPPAPSTR